ncbi:DUF262 domain-containing protein [Sphingobacterium kyonggiense]
MQNILFDDSYEYRFNPNDIDISIQQISLFYLLRRLEKNEIDLFADYQRNWNLWSAIQQSRLIESILIRIPIPSFYFDSNDDGEWQVVDGLQRVTTFYNFIVKENFKLIGLEFLPEFNGYRFSELPKELQRRIEEFPLNIYLINRGTPEEIKFIIFSRINTGGIKLNNQELRFALNQGAATNLLIELAQSDEFKDATFHSINPKRMNDYEYINRFLAFYLFKIDYNGNLETFMNNCLVQINKYNSDIEHIKSVFFKSMLYSIKIFGENRFKKIDIDRIRKSRINKALFDAISVNLAWLEIPELENLVRNKEELNFEFENIFNDKYFNEAISFATNSRNKVEYRFETVFQLFKKFKL